MLQAALRAHITGQSTCFTTYCHLEPNLRQSPLNVCGCFAFAWASVCSICVLTRSSITATGLHTDSQQITSPFTGLAALHECVFFLLLVVICGWIKTLLIRQSFPSHPPPPEVMRSRLWFNHRCAVLTGIDWKQWLFHNLQEDVMMSLYTPTCTRKRRNVMT